MAIEAFEEALADVSKLRHSTDPKTRARAELQYERIKQLLELARLGKRLDRDASRDGEDRRRAARSLPSAAERPRRTADRRRARRRGALALLLGAAVGVGAGCPAIERNDYALELFQGPLLAPGRITGLAGATTATAQSLEGVYNNAAAPAVREPQSLDHFEWEPTARHRVPRRVRRNRLQQPG